MALLWGGPSDWLDGRLARLDGATSLGALLDIEADSWLSLWAAAAAHRAGDLPALSLLPPVVRPLRPQSDAHCTRQRVMPSSFQKKWRQSSEIIKRRAIGRRREDLNRHVIGAGVVVEPHLGRDRAILAPGDNRIEDTVATR